MLRALDRWHLVVGIKAQRCHEARQLRLSLPDFGGDLHAPQRQLVVLLSLRGKLGAQHLDTVGSRLNQRQRDSEIDVAPLDTIAAVLLKLAQGNVEVTT
ncbi:hypothetical protein PJP10_05420 [Mycobacterium kansasii]